MLRDFQIMFFGLPIDLLQMVAAVLSVVAAAISLFSLRRATVRAHGLEKEYLAKVEPWLKQARLEYGKESGKRLPTKKPKNRPTTQSEPEA